MARRHVNDLSSQTRLGSQTAFVESRSHLPPSLLTFRQRYTPFTDTQLKGHNEEFVGVEQGPPGLSSPGATFVVVTEETLCVVETRSVVEIRVGLGVTNAYVPGWTAVLSPPAEVQAV
jgi:hypothetical protein